MLLDIKVRGREGLSHAILKLLNTIQHSQMEITSTNERLQIWENIYSHEKKPTPSYIRQC